MCPACLSTLALITAGAGSAGGLGAVIAKKVLMRLAAQGTTHSTPVEPPANEEEIR